MIVVISPESMKFHFTALFGNITLNNFVGLIISQK